SRKVPAPSPLNCKSVSRRSGGKVSIHASACCGSRAVATSKPGANEFSASAAKARLASSASTTSAFGLSRDLEVAAASECERHRSVVKKFNRLSRELIANHKCARFDLSNVNHQAALRTAAPRI